MATSGSVNFKLIRDRMMDTAFELAGVKDPNRALTASEGRTGVRILQMMLKAWNADGLHLWKKGEGVVLPVIGQASYSLGPNGGHACLLADLVVTAADGDQTVSTSLSVEDAAGIAANDTVLIDVDDVLTPATVSDVSGNDLTISTLGGVDVSDGAIVYAYTSKIERPTRILDARRVVTTSGYEVPLWLLSREEYFAQVNKTARGTVIQAYYDPQLDNGTLYLWQTPSRLDEYVQFTFERQIQDVDSPTDDFDLPQEWQEALTWNLADRLATVYGCSNDRKTRLKAEAMEYRAAVESFDQEAASVFIQPTFR